LTEPAARLGFPTVLHRQAAELAGRFFNARAEVDTVLVVNSCARGLATCDSHIDLAVLVNPGTSLETVQGLEAAWQELRTQHPLLRQFRAAGRFTQVHLDVFDGRFAPPIWDDGGGPDAFEVEIGNRVAYSAPLDSPGPYFGQLQARWLPYYDDDLRQRRLAMIREACVHDLDHVPFFLNRGLCFQAFDRLYKAFQEFLQVLFVARKTYPLAYNKWIREQVTDWLGLPDLYRELPPIIAVRDIESGELSEKAAALRALLDRWVPLRYSTQSDD
jgi:predicted nucleotidyltransferase